MYTMYPFCRGEFRLTSWVRIRVIIILQLKINFVVNLKEEEEVVVEVKEVEEVKREKKNLQYKDGCKVVGATWRYIRARLHLLRTFFTDAVTPSRSLRPSLVAQHHLTRASRFFALVVGTCVDDQQQQQQQ